MDEIEERNKSFKSLIKIIVSKYNEKLKTEKRRGYVILEDVKKSLKQIIEKQVLRNKLKDSVKDLINEDKDAVVNTIALFIFDDLQNNTLDVEHAMLPRLFEHFLSKQGES